VRFEQADAATYSFAAEHFDIAISRFGTMFFGEPIVAFRNIASALRPGGRLLMMVWQDSERNQWFVSIRHAVMAGGSNAMVFQGMPDPFSFADPFVVERILAAAGFSHIGFTDVQEPVYYGRDVATALQWVRGFSCTQVALRELDAAATESALERLRKLMAVHQNESGVWFGSRAWIVDARRRERPRRRGLI
jgi:SAM-dependent methyltransferase